MTSSQRVMAVEVEQLARMAAKLDPSKIAEYNSEMEQQLAQRMQHMSPQELHNLETVKQFVTDKTIQVLTSPPAVEAPASSSFPPEVQQDQDLLHILRTQPADVFIGAFLHQKRTRDSQLRFHSDPDAHPLLHWAALEDNLDVVDFLCQQVKVPVDQQNGKGETALHWACVKGHTRTIHLLLARFNASSQLVDNKGYSLLHIAAQNGHVLVLAQLNRPLVGNMTNLDARDSAFRTPLHWASYRGYEQVCRWLLVHGADSQAEDHERCTPLHWAAIRAHSDVCQLLVHLGGAGAKLLAQDSTGKTPRALAEGKLEQCSSTTDRMLAQQYRNVIRVCLEGEERQRAVDGNQGRPTLRMRVSGKLPHASYFLWPVLAPIAFYQYCTVLLPVTSHFLVLHLVFLVCFFSKWFFWARLQLKDPGDYVVPRGPPGTVPGFGTVAPSWGWRRNGWPDFTLKRSAGDAEEATLPNTALLPDAARHRELYHRVLDEGLLVPVCVTCEIVKPVRAKHDAISNVCVLKFDHFCPWMNACIGQFNYMDFFLTALMATVAMWLWVFFVFQYTWEFNTNGSFWQNARDIGLAWEAFAWFFALVALYGSAMTGQHIQLASRNLSTNEMLSGWRYRYLVDDGTRGNPFDRGSYLVNFMELFGLVPALPNMDPEKYHHQAFQFGGKPEELTPAMIGSPWHRKTGGGGGSHGHTHGGGDGDCHGHSH